MQVWHGDVEDLHSDCLLVEQPNSDRNNNTGYRFFSFTGELASHAACPEKWWSNCYQPFLGDAFFTASMLVLGGWYVRATSHSFWFWPCFSHGVLRPNSLGMLQLLKHRNIMGLDCETTSIKQFSFLESKMTNFEVEDGNLVSLPAVSLFWGGDCKPEMCQSATHLITPVLVPKQIHSQVRCDSADSIRKSQGSGRKYLEALWRREFIDILLILAEGRNLYELHGDVLAVGSMMSFQLKDSHSHGLVGNMERDAGLWIRSGSPVGRRHFRPLDATKVFCWSRVMGTFNRAQLIS